LHPNNVFLTSGVVTNLELGNARGSGSRAPSGVQGVRCTPEAESFLFLDIPREEPFSPHLKLS